MRKVVNPRKLETLNIEETEAAKALMDFLWGAFETSMPASPQHLTTLIFGVLEEHGFAIVKSDDEANPVDVAALLERSLREEIADAIEAQAEGIADTPFNRGFSHAVFTSATIARGVDE